MSDKSAPIARAHNLENLDHVTRVQPCSGMAEKLKLSDSTMADGPMEMLRQELQRAGFTDPEVEALLAQWNVRIRKVLKQIFKNIAVSTYLRVQQGAPLTSDTLMECFEQIADQTEDHMVYVRDYRQRQHLDEQEDDQGNENGEDNADINRAQDQGANPEAENQGANPEAQGAEGGRPDNGEILVNANMPNDPPVNVPADIDIVVNQQEAAVNEPAQAVQPVPNENIQNVGQDIQDNGQVVPPRPIHRIPIRRAIRSRVEPYYRPPRYPGPHNFSIFGPYGPMWPPYPNFGPQPPYPRPRRHYGPF